MCYGARHGRGCASRRCRLFHCCCSASHALFSPAASPRPWRFTPRAWSGAERLRPQPDSAFTVQIKSVMPEVSVSRLAQWWMDRRQRDALPVGPARLLVTMRAGEQLLAAARPHLKEPAVRTCGDYLAPKQMNVVMRISQSAAAAHQNCMSLQACVEILCALKLMGTAHKTVSSVDDDAGCWRSEAGIELDLHGVQKADVCERLWPLLQQRFGLECAHVRLRNGQFAGCIYDWMRPSACPAVLRRRADATDSFALITLA